MDIKMDQESHESFSFFPLRDSYSDHESNFTSSKTSASTFSARSSLSLPSFSSSSSSTSAEGAAIRPLPHHRSDPHWSALRATANLSHDGLLHLRHFRLLRPLGSGHLARVFHCRINGFDETNSDGVQPDFALKVIDLDAIARSSTDADNLNADDGAGDGKMWHVRAEARALAELDHPFLPTLYARLDAGHYACYLIDYCSGGDLNVLLHRVRGHRLPLSAARFYAAEVLIGLEYLHTLGIVYRDLKPENVLLRADGHIMLSDFDLSFHSDVTPAVLRQSKVRRRRRRWSLCGSLAAGEEEDEELEFVAEPYAAQSKACVGTHEYLAPEVANGRGHGSGVDWWAFGVFLYELLYGKTPFKGATKEATIRNILNKEVSFLEANGRGAADGGELAKANDLIAKLLVKDPQQRLGAIGGAAEIKRHPFFDGVRWALVRCARPPLVPGEDQAGAGSGARVQWRVTKEEKGRWWRWSNKSRDNGGDDNKQKKRVGLGFRSIK